MTAARAERIERERERERREALADAEGEQWEKAEGPLPEDAWGQCSERSGAERVVSFRYDWQLTKMHHSHLWRLAGGAHVLQEAYFPGWRFFVAVLRREPTAKKVSPRW